MIRDRLQRSPSLDAALFAGALLVFLGTRLYGIERFPIYFFTDEAIQTLSAAYLVESGGRNTLGELLPTYFPNGPYLNLSVSVYVQVVPYLLFGLSETVTRATSVLIALSGTAAVGLTLRDAFRVRFWWLATLLLAATPAWFLHSRTAFETVLAASFYAWFLFFALRLRSSATWNLFPALAFAALAFYSYAATQIVVVATLAAFAVSDVRLFLRKPRALLAGLAFLGLLSLPYARHYAAHAEEISNHLHTLGSYWVADAPLGDKLRRFRQEYLLGLDPRYWYGADNERDLVRHQMRGWGHILAATLPFAALGVLVCLRSVRSRVQRGLLLATLACPLGGALVETAVTRTLVLVVPVALLTAVGAASLLSLVSRRVAYAWVAAAVFTVLAAVNVAIARDALASGPTWYRDYGLYGLQYGGRQVTAAIGDYLGHHPDARVVLSPTWANGTDVVVRFFLPDEPRVQFGSIAGWQLDPLPLGEQDVFVVTPEEFGVLRDDPKFADVRVERTLPYPDGRPGFYFVRFRYSPAAKTIFAAELRERRKPVHSTVSIDGQRVAVTHSRLDIGAIESVFDGDSFTLARTLEANPAVVRLSFARGRVVRGVAVTTGMGYVRAHVAVAPVGTGAERVYAAGYPRGNENPTLSIGFDRAIRAKEVEIRRGSRRAGPDARSSPRDRAAVTGGASERRSDPPLAPQRPRLP